MQDISTVKYYGITMLIDVLKGVAHKRIIDNKLNELAIFGIYKDMPREILRSIVEWMINEKLILKTKGKYPVLHSTYEWLHYSEIITEEVLPNMKKILPSPQQSVT